MRGIVKGLSANGLRAAVLTDYGYTVFDMEDRDVAVGDVVSGNLDDHGDQDLANETTGHRFSGYVEAIHAGLENARSLLANR